MATQQYFVLLYSKYSARSKKFLQLMREYSIDFVDTLCIDNKALRKQVKSSVYNVMSVPCLLIFYSSSVVGEKSNVEKYEDEHAFSWLDEIVKMKMRESVMASPPPQYVQEEQQVTPISSVGSVGSIGEEQSPLPPTTELEPPIITSGLGPSGLGPDSDRQQKIAEAVKKTSSITTMAQEMQKAREAFDGPKRPGMR